jgi:hypothetical protein
MSKSEIEYPKSEIQYYLLWTKKNHSGFAVKNVYF